MQLSILDFRILCEKLNINSFSYTTRNQPYIKREPFAADIELKDMFISVRPNIISFSNGKSRFTFWAVKRVHIKYNIRYSQIVVMIECLGRNFKTERYVLTKNICPEQLGKYAPESLPAECDVIKWIVSKYI